MTSAISLRKGNVILYKSEPHRVMHYKHRTPGKGAAIVRLLLRNLISGASYEIRFNSQESIERATLEQQEMEYLYSDGTHYQFMHTETYDQLALSDEQLGESRRYLKEGLKIQVEFFEENPIGIEMPSYVELEVVETEPELRGATASNSPKPATLENGVVVQVPPFISAGEIVRVDPVEGRYLERAK